MSLVLDYLFQMRNARLELDLERQRMRIRRVCERKRIDGMRRILRDVERPEDACGVDEQRAVRDVLSRADSAEGGLVSE